MQALMFGTGSRLCNTAREDSKVRSKAGNISSLCCTGKRTANYVTGSLFCQHSWSKSVKTQSYGQLRQLVRTPPTFSLA